MESEFFDTRQAFLSLCQGNHYQYDTLRRAKHSSMMMLYHLHNPTAPAFVVTCNTCSSDIEAGQGWRCEICADFDLCNNCKALSNHQHKLTPLTERNAQNKEARQQRVLQVRLLQKVLSPVITLVIIRIASVDGFCINHNELWFIHTYTKKGQPALRSSGIGSYGGDDT